MDLVRDIGFIAAFWGGSSAFFSPWQLCIMQISPFFLAFAVGLYLAESKHTESPVRPFIIMCAGYLLAFSIVFAFMGIPRFGISRYILYNKEIFRTCAAIYIGFLAAWLLLYGVFGKGGIKRWLYLPVGLLLGASLAVAYSPCITPAMSEIMNFAGRSENVMKGFYLLTIYGVGLSISFSASGMAIALALDRSVKGKRARSAIIIVSALTLLGISILLVSGLMSTYKSMLVGLFLE